MWSKPLVFRLPALYLLFYCLLFVSPTFSESTESKYEQLCNEIADPAQNIGEHSRLYRLFDAYWQHKMISHPELATQAGYSGQNGRWTDRSLEALAKEMREQSAPVKALSSIDRTKLSSDDQLNFDLFKYKIDLELSERPFFMPSQYLMITQLDHGIQQVIPMTISQNPTQTSQDYREIITRLNGIPQLIDQTLILLDEGRKNGITPPKVVLHDVDNQIRSLIEGDVSLNPLFRPFKQFPSTIDASVQQQLQEQAKQAIVQKDVPAFEKLRNYFLKSYLPNCRSTIAWSDLPEGRSWYLSKLQQHLSTNSLTPDQVHTIGVSEVKRIRTEIESLMKEIGCKESFNAFLAYMRTAPKFFYSDSRELLIGYRDIAKRIDPELMKLFGKLPRQQYGIAAFPSSIERSSPDGDYYYGSTYAGRPGILYVNTYKLETRPKWEMEVLALHETVPGHHLQMSLAQEQESIPEFRKFQGDGYTAYIEGWALYSEGLGKELGLYQDPYSRFGQLNSEMLRAIRLVVDTGLHTQGWTRQQAINYFEENCSLPQHDVEVEVDRYLVDPAQALAYKIGQMRILELKSKAKQELKSNFDVRNFHDRVLSLGAVPLDVLSGRIDEWIIAQQSHQARE